MDSSSKLKLADNLLYAEKDGKHLFLRPDIPDWIVVNGNGAITLSQCDGRTALGDIIEQLPIDTSLSSQVRELFSQARARGILVSPVFVAPTRISCTSDGQDCAPHDQPKLKTVYLKLTGLCNLRCNYCYAQSDLSADELSLEDLKSIANSVACISKSVEYVLSGGEPLLNRHTLDFAEMVKASGNVVHILTNGTLIDEQNVERVSNVADLVKISLDGSTEHVHSLTRGKDNFDKVGRVVDRLVGLRANVLVAMTVTKENRGDIAAMVSRFGSRLTFQPLFKAGRGKDEDHLRLTGAEYYEALSSVDGVAPMARVASTLDSLRGRGVRRCALAGREISISESGDVYPCQLLHAAEFKAGNIRKSSLAEIYYNAPLLKRVREITVDSLVKCSTCHIRYICGGACRARDFYEVGSIEEVGDFCEYEKQAFINGIFESVELAAI